MQYVDIECLLRGRCSQERYEQMPCRVTPCGIEIWSKFKYRTF